MVSYVKFMSGWIPAPNQIPFFIDLFAINMLEIVIYKRDYDYIIDKEG